MKLVNKQEYEDHITRTYWSFWMWSLLTFLALFNVVMSVVPSMLAISVLLINIYVLATKYQEHKALRAEYDRRYPPTFNKSTYELEETEQEDR